MTEPKTEVQTRIRDASVELDRFERQATTIMALVLVLSLVSYSILLQVLP